MKAKEGFTPHTVMARAEGNNSHTYDKAIVLNSSASMLRKWLFTADDVAALPTGRYGIGLNQAAADAAHIATIMDGHGLLDK